MLYAPLLSVLATTALGASLAAVNTLPLPTNKAADPQPVVDLSYGSFRGNSSGGINTFYGIPFAQPPYV